MAEEYCCFELADRTGMNVVDSLSVRYTEAPVDGLHCVRMVDHQRVFHAKIVDDPDDPQEKKIAVDEDGVPVLRGEFHIGWDNLPMWTFDPDTKEFSPFDPHPDQWFRHNYRRRVIDPEIRRQVKEGTELKIHRKAMLAIIDAVPGLKDHPDIQEFLRLSDVITRQIGKYQKSEFDNIDLKEVNGVSESRVKALHAHGVDYGPTKADMVKDNYPDGGKEELLKRAEIHTVRRNLEGKR